LDRILKTKHSCFLSVVKKQYKEIKMKKAKVSPLPQKMEDSYPGKESILLYVILFCIAFLPRLIYLLSISHNPFFHFPVIDGQTYDDWAQEIAQGHCIGDKVFWQAPLYPYFLGIIYSIFGHDLFLARFIQVLLGSINCLLLFKITKTAFSSRIAWIAFFIASFYGPFLFFDAELLNPVLIIFLNLCLILVLFSFSHSLKKNQLFLTGIILGLSSVTHGLVVVFLPFVLLWIVFLLLKKEFPWGKIVKYSITFLIGFLLIISVTTVRNLLVGDDFVWISSNSGINFFIGNNPDYDHTTTIRPGIEWEELIQKPLQHGLVKPSERSNYFWRESFSYISHHPVSYAELLFKKFLLLMDGFEIKRNQDMYLFRDYSFLLRVLLWKWWIYFPLGLILPLGFLGMIIYLKDRSRSETKDPKPLLVLYFTLSQILALLFFFVCDRYRIPLVPFLIIFASFAIYYLYRMFKSKQSRELMIFLPLLLLLILLSNFHRHPVTAKDQAEEHFNLGTVLVRQLKLDPAEREFKLALTFEPNLLMAHFNLALLYQNENRTAEAEKEYQQVIQLLPQAALAYNNLGLIYEGRGDLSKAREMYQNASRFHPLLPDPLYNLGNLNMQEGKYPQAKQMLDSCLKVDPNYYKAYNGLGDYYFRSGDVDKAIGLFQKALALHPDYDIAHNNLGTAYAQKGMKQMAFDEFKKAIQINPDYGSAHLNLGNYFLETQQVSNAIDQYKKAVGLMPHNSRTHYHLAVAYLMAGFEKDAVAELDTALSIDTSFVQAKDLLERVKKK
jgi:tetratricopeptide (TPR) repeat protein